MANKSILEIGKLSHKNSLQYLGIKNDHVWKTADESSEYDKHTAEEFNLNAIQTEISYFNNSNLIRVINTFQWNPLLKSAPVYMQLSWWALVKNRESWNYFVDINNSMKQSCHLAHYTSLLTDIELTISNNINTTNREKTHQYG